MKKFQKKSIKVRFKKWPHVTSADIRALVNVASDPNIKRQIALQEGKLSKGWCKYLNVKHSLLCSSGTAALHLALSGAGVKKGDEVIVPAFSWWATAAAIMQQGAIPIFVDVEKDFFCIDPEKIEYAITKKTRGILVVHIHGMPTDMDKIKIIANKYNLVIIEDAAQAQGSKYKKRKCGTLGDVAAFSLETSKNLTTGSSGGILTTNSKSIFNAANKARQFKGDGLGWGYRGDVFGQAFANSQLKRLDKYNKARIRNANYLIKNLWDTEGIRIVNSTAERSSNFYNFVITFHPDELNLNCESSKLRDDVCRFLNKNGISAGLWMSDLLPELDMFRQRKIMEKYPIAKKFVNSGLYIFGIHYPNNIRQMEYCVRVIKKGLNKFGKQ